MGRRRCSTATPASFLSHYSAGLGDLPSYVALLPAYEVGQRVASVLESKGFHSCYETGNLVLITLSSTFYRLSTASIRVVLSRGCSHVSLVVWLYCVVYYLPYLPSIAHEWPPNQIPAEGPSRRVHHISHCILSSSLIVPYQGLSNLLLSLKQLYIFF